MPASLSILSAHLDASVRTEEASGNAGLEGRSAVDEVFTRGVVLAAANACCICATLSDDRATLDEYLCTRGILTAAVAAQSATNTSEKRNVTLGRDLAAVNGQLAHVAPAADGRKVSAVLKYAALIFACNDDWLGNQLTRILLLTVDAERLSFVDVDASGERCVVTDDEVGSASRLWCAEDLTLAVVIHDIPQVTDSWGLAAD